MGGAVRCWCAEARAASGASREGRLGVGSTRAWARGAPLDARRRALLCAARPGARPTFQRQLGHANLGITSIYLQGIDNAEIIDTIQRRPPPMIPATAGLGLPAVPWRF